jgi:hypothetical protein
LALAAGAAALVCAACGSSSPPAALTPVSLHKLHGNSSVGATYDFDVGADGRLSVQRLARTVRLTATESVMTVTRSAGRGRLNAAERRQLRAYLGRVDLRQLRAVGVRGACHGAPVGDVGGVLLDVGGVRTDCPPASAQPLVSWLERLAAATPEKVSERTVHVTHLRRASSVG